MVNETSKPVTKIVLLDENIAVASCQEGCVSVFDLNQHQLLHKIQAQQPIHSLSYYFSTDVNQLFVSLGKDIGVINLHETETPEIEIISDLEGLNCLDCRLGILATPTSNQIISLYELDKKRIVKYFDTQGG